VILTEGSTIESSDLMINQSTPKIKKEEKQLTLDEMENSFIQETLETNGGNISKTANALGLTRTALYRRLKKYGI
jgi:transcriptional regulator of acetoin/glycerol metabolism